MKTPIIYNLDGKKQVNKALIATFFFNKMIIEYSMFKETMEDNVYVKRPTLNSFPLLGIRLG